MKKFAFALLLVLLSFSGFTQKFMNSPKFGYLYALFDSSGKQLSPYKYQIANDFFEDLAAVSTNGKWGFIDRTGKEIIKCKYAEVQNFSENMCPVNKKGKWIFINKKNKQVIKQSFQYAFAFTEGLAAVKIYDKWGYINTEGEFVIPPKFESAYPFSEGLASVRSHNMWGYIGRNGRVYIDFNFDVAGPFKNNQAQVMINSRKLFIDKHGKVIEQEKNTVKKVKIYKRSEKMPVFPGGNEKLFEFIDQNLQYPEEEKSKEVSGTVIVKVLINEDGSISNPKIIQGLTTNCDKEAVRLIKLMPAWQPGTNKGKPVKVQLQIPIEFSL